MGFFDEIGQIIGDYKSLGDEVTQTAKDIGSDLKGTADETIDTIKETGQQLSSTMDDLKDHPSKD